MPSINRVDQFNLALSQGEYAWPGGYPLYFITKDGEALSFKVAKHWANAVREAIIFRCDPQWEVVGIDINWENHDLVCAHTGKKIEAAYDPPYIDPVLGPKAMPVRVEGYSHIWVDLVGKEWTRYVFSDEADQFHGPWLTVEEAVAQMMHYCKYELHTGLDYVIQRISHSDEFWSNEQGWVGKESASKFSPGEQKSLNLPMGGKWVNALTQ